MPYVFHIGIGLIAVQRFKNYTMGRCPKILNESPPVDVAFLVLLIRYNGHYIGLNLAVQNNLASPSEQNALCINRIKTKHKKKTYITHICICVCVCVCDFVAPAAICIRLVLSIIGRIYTIVGIGRLKWT